MWGFHADSHWRGPDAAIVNHDWTVNEAGLRYQALREEWRTNDSGTPIAVEIILSEVFTANMM